MDLVSLLSIRFYFRCYRRHDVRPSANEDEVATMSKSLYMISTGQL